MEHLQKGRMSLLLWQAARPTECFSHATARSIREAEWPSARMCWRRFATPDMLLLDAGGFAGGGMYDSYTEGGCMIPCAL